MKIVSGYGGFQDSGTQLQNADARTDAGDVALERVRFKREKRVRNMYRDAKRREGVADKSSPSTNSKNLLKDD